MTVRQTSEMSPLNNGTPWGPGRTTETETPNKKFQCKLAYFQFGTCTRAEGRFETQDITTLRPEWLLFRRGEGRVIVWSRDLFESVRLTGAT